MVGPDQHPVPARKLHCVGAAKLGRGLPAEDLQIRLPDLPDRFTTVENNDGESFFCISSTLIGRGDELAWAPKRVAIAWDASGSRQSLDREYDLLRELLAAWDDTVIDVVVFRNRLDDERRSIAPGESQAADLLTYLQGLPYDGGTDLTALDLSSPAHAECEAWLLVSDGLGAIDPGLPKIQRRSNSAEASRLLRSTHHSERRLTSAPISVTTTRNSAANQLSLRPSYASRSAL